MAHLRWRQEEVYIQRVWLNRALELCGFPTLPEIWSVIFMKNPAGSLPATLITSSPLLKQISCIYVFPYDDLLCIKVHFTHNVNFTANYPNASYPPKLSLLEAVSCLVWMPKLFLKHSGFYWSVLRQLCISMILII